MKRIYCLVGILSLLIIALGVGGCDSLSAPTLERAPSNSSQNTGIWVIGEGEVTVRPDLAVLQLGVESVAANVADAYAGANEAMADFNVVIADDADLQTGSFSISQLTRYSDDGSVTITGYRVSNTVTAKIRTEPFESMTLDAKVSSLLDAAVKAGGDSIRIQGLSFTVEDPSVYYDEAREMALANAQEKAEQIATSAGLKLGEATYIAENSSYYPYSPDYGMAIPAPVVITESGSFFSPGETTITVTMQVAYSID
jgi:uncharacterized protein YggE